MQIKTLAKDVIGVTHISSPIESSIIEIPETAKDSVRTVLVKAQVRLIGSKFRFKDEVKVGDLVYVPYHLGNRMHSIMFDGKVLILYDGEDVLAKVTG